MKGKVYLLALTILISFISLQVDNLYFILVFTIWINYLYIKKYINIIYVVIIIISQFISYVFLPGPFVDSEVIEYDDKLNSGQIISQIFLKENYLSFTIENELKNRALVKYFYKNDVHEIQQLLKNLKYGAHCEINADFQATLLNTNPGQFNYAAYLSYKSIQYEVILKEQSDLFCKDQSLISPILEMRNNLLFKIKSKYSEFTSGWIIALILGEDSFIDVEYIELFRKWNLAHLLAISGLHTGIVVALFYYMLLRLFRMTIENAQIILMIVLPLFIIISGAEPSVIRASLMVIIYLILNKFGLKINAIDLISIIFIFLVMVNPLILFHVGFQFSFSVTFSLLVSSHLLKASSNILLQSLQISFVSQMFILPLQVHYFTIFQPLSILVNIIVIPYFTLFVIPLMFFLLLSIRLPTLIISTLDELFIFIHAYFLKILTKLDLIFTDYFIIGDLEFYHFFIYYLIFLSFMRLLENRLLLKSIVTGLLLCIFILYLSEKESFSNTGLVTMLDIGQGDAFIIEKPRREGVFMMDIGSTFSFTDMKPSRHMYDHVIKPYLYSRGIDTIDGIFLSHNHIDHVGSLSFIIEDFKVKEVFISPYHIMDKETILKLDSKNIVLTTIDPVSKIISNNQIFNILHPIKDENDENNNSLIIYTEIGGLSWLFNGDASMKNEIDLINKYPKLKADVLKIGHHGSNTSTNKVFLEQLKPKYGLISVGENNSYGHPTEEVITSLTESEVEIFRTDNNGAVQYFYNKNKSGFIKMIK